MPNFQNRLAREFPMRHLRRWENCKGCKLHEHRRQVVLWRGSIPADVLFVGEAPGAEEDRLGLPFTGPAGSVLDKIIKTALASVHFSYCISNLVACYPVSVNTIGLYETREPTAAECVACRPRLFELYRRVDPTLLVTLGDLARQRADFLMYYDRSDPNASSLTSRDPMTSLPESGLPGGLQNAPFRSPTSWELKDGTVKVHPTAPKLLSLPHPARILRQPGEGMAARCVADLITVVEGLCQT